LSKCITLAAFLVLVVPPQTWAQDAGPPPESQNISKNWDSVLRGWAETPRDPILVPKQPIDTKPKSDSDFLNHFFFESRTEYRRYSTDFTGQATATGIIDAPFTGFFNPAGSPYQPAFQPTANQVYSFVDFGTRGWLSDRVNTHFAFLYNQDVTQVNSGAPAIGVLETFPNNRTIQLQTATVEVQGKATDGMFAGTDLVVGRQFVYGADMAALDGASFTVDRQKYEVTIFGGRRFTYYSDPVQRAIGGANVIFRLPNETTLEYSGLWYVRGENSLTLRKRFSNRWLVSTYFRAYGGAPVDFNVQGYYSSQSGKTSVRLSFFQKLTDKDYPYDFSYYATDQSKYDTLQRLYLGPLSPYSQFVVDANHNFRRFRLGGSTWVRRLNNAAQQGPFDTSFQDYRAHAQIFTPLKTETYFEYHQRNSDRLNPDTATTFFDTQTAGETSVKDITGTIRRSFAEGRFGFSGGVYYRRISLQDQFYIIQGSHESGWLTDGWIKVDSHTKLYFDYNLDNDFFLFRPSIANSRILRVGAVWKY
jgi:hypothetical protein